MASSTGQVWNCFVDPRGQTYKNMSASVLDYEKCTFRVYD